MFFQKKLANAKEREQTEQLSNEFNRLTNKEQELIGCITNPEYTATYMSMLLLKADFILNEVNSFIRKIDDTAMAPSVKQIHIMTAENMVKRLEHIKATIIQAQATLKTSSNLETEAKRQEILTKLVQACGKENP
jgi:hypothetical protein